MLSSVAQTWGCIIIILGLCQITLRLHEVHSLKEKRSIVQGLLTRMRNRLNAGVAEVGAHDIWGRADIALCTVGLSEAIVRNIFHQAEMMAEKAPGAEIVDFTISLL